VLPVLSPFAVTVPACIDINLAVGNRGGRQVRSWAVGLAELRQRREEKVGEGLLERVGDAGLDGRKAV